MLEESLLIIKLKDQQIDYVNDHFINIFRTTIEQFGKKSKN